MKNTIFLTYLILLTVGLSFSVQAADVVNVSSRSSVGSGEETFFVSFVVSGESGELTPIFACGSGPIHPDIQNPIVDAFIDLYQVNIDAPNEIIASSDNWQREQQELQISATGIAPDQLGGAGLIHWVEPGAYSLALSDNTGAGGIGVAEVYEMVFKDIPNSLLDADEFDTLMSALETATPSQDLLTLLSGDGPFTVFAPTDRAFQNLNDDYLNSFLADPESLADLLLYHVVVGEVPAAEFSTAQLDMANGKKATLWMTEGEGVMFKDAKVIETDFYATNGVIHVVDEVLILPAEEWGLLIIMLNEGNFSIWMDTFFDIRNSTGETVWDREKLPLTYFAPVNDAWADLPEGYLDSLSREELLQIMRYTAIEGAALDTASLTTGPVTNRGGLDLDIVVSETGITVNGANVIVADIMSVNGVIHAIDTVLLPPGL